MTKNTEKQSHTNNELERMLLRMYSLTEIRMQKMKPAQKGHYYSHMVNFWKTFSARPETAIQSCKYIVLVGEKKYFEDILKIINPEIEKIQQITGKKIEKFFVFVGPGEIMEKFYRGAKESQPPYNFAINGALDCFINTDWIKELGIQHPAARRTIIHEPRHIAWSLTITKNGLPTFQTDGNKIVHEALGGPLEIDLWKDLELLDIPDAYSGLENGQSFRDWYREMEVKSGHFEKFFLNPVSRLFYEWARSKGDEKFWYQKAKAIKY